MKKRFILIAMICLNLFPTWVNADTLTLSDAMLINSTGEETVDDAIEVIEAKGDPDFSVVATTDEGLYATEDDYGTSYYYRGAVEDNYVYFAGYYWRIIRRNGDGSVRLIYDGTSAHENGENSDDRLIGTSAFNENYDDNAYVGYMFGTVGSSTYDETHENINDSTIKIYIDSWYKEKLINYEDYLSDEIFCNDRSLYSGTGTGTEQTSYTGYERLFTQKNPILTCTQKNDAFTVSDKTNGNGDLTYPIALISADEVAMAGSSYYANNSSYYLYTGNSYYTMSPDHFDGTSIRADVWRVHSFGWIGSNYNAYGGVEGSYDVKPVINISSEVLVSSGNGTIDSPYILSLPVSESNQTNETNTTTEEETTNPNTGLETPYVVGSILITGSVILIFLYRKEKYM